MSREQIKQFLNAMYGGRGKNGEAGFDPGKGLLFDNLPKLGPNRLLSEEVRCRDLSICLWFWGVGAL